ncbi:MAG: Sodium-dependent dicarboxylate transporter SdcS [Chlamydiae bacterium]|nr:Sodium-dependent dicarboxylate transporter SdcS [Chlamydiota bacterium]
MAKKKILSAAIIFLLALLFYLFLPDTFSESAKRTAAIFIFAAGFWALEVIPLYATSFLVVIFLAFFLTNTEGLFVLEKRTYMLFLAPFSSPIIMLFLGGFVLAAAIRKHRVDEFLMKRMLIKIGNRSHVILLGFLLMSGFFSMWISNTASTALMLLLIKPILKQIDHDDPFRKSLVLAVAFGANIGGIATPIGTPPNAIAVGILADHGINLSFLGWMVMAVPLSLFIMILAALALILFFPPKTTFIKYKPPPRTPLSPQAKWVMVVACFIILLWLTKPIHQIPEALVALLGVGILSAFQLIGTEDFKRIDWDILVLMWGGLALGQGMQTSGLIDHFISLPIFAAHGIALVAALCFLAVILSSFMSNTATANILLPIAMSFTAFDKSLLSITVALSCSFALAFPISTPPNAMAYSLGTFKTKDMFKVGAPLTLIAVIVVLLGFEYIIPKAFNLFV